MKQTAVYCGAFNPPTIAHKNVIESVINVWLADRIIFCPTGPREDKTYGIKEEIREEIFEIFSKEIHTLWIPMEVSRYFYQDGSSVNTTTRWVDTYITQEYWVRPHHIFGYDVISKIADWSDNPWKYIEKKLKKIFISRPEYIADFSGLCNYQVIDLGERNINISSTLVRKILNKWWKISHLTTPNVGSFLEENSIIYN